MSDISRRTVRPHRLRTNGRPAMAWLLGLCLALGCQSSAWAGREHKVHFADTAYELHVFHITGRSPGPTLMLIGGIQGNEPGGFLSADLYADLTLERGNLIVVPRANFHSIMRGQRGPRGDMNRKFDRPTGRDTEIRVVKVLKELIAQSDCLLNLHDGSGFYRPRWISPSMNPRRFGQSIIADADVFVHPATGRTVRLAELAEAVCRDINLSITDETHHFRFNNHRTLEPGSPNAEQRGSATFYALTKIGIPAFGVETSKELPSIELKVRHHNLAINAFMKQLGIVPENPPVNLSRPRLRYLVLSINDLRPLVVADGESLKLNRGDTVFISHIEANKARGLSCDVLGLGSINDTRRRLKVIRSTSIIVRRDHVRCGSVRLVLAKARPGTSAGRGGLADHFLVRINDREVVVAEGRTVDVVRGDRLELLASRNRAGKKTGLALNFKGFVANPGNNTGDDRGAPINTASDLMKRWSVDGRGALWRVEAENGGRAEGRFFIRLTEPDLAYVILRTGRAPAYALAPGERLRLSVGDSFTVVDLKANFDTGHGVTCHLRRGTRLTRIEMGSPVRLEATGGDGGAELTIRRYQTDLGTIVLEPQAATANRGGPERPRL